MSTTCNRCRNFSKMERSHTKTKLLNNIYMQESFLGCGSSNGCLSAFMNHFKEKIEPTN